MNNEKIVRDWFAKSIRTGAIARDTEALNQASAALPFLIKALGSNEPGVASVQSALSWSRERILCGAIAREPASLAQAEAAVPVLTALLSPAADTDTASKLKSGTASKQKTDTADTASKPESGTAAAA